MRNLTRLNIKLGEMGRVLSEERLYKFVRILQNKEERDAQRERETFKLPTILKPSTNADIEIGVKGGYLIFYYTDNVQALSQKVIDLASQLGYGVLDSYITNTQRGLTEAAA